MNLKMTDSVNNVASHAGNDAVHDEYMTGKVQMSKSDRSKKAVRLLTEQLFAGLA